MIDWDRLDAELDAWRAAGRRATLWWRDDDASRASAALARLLAIAQAHRTPIALAVIPAMLEPSLVAALASAREATVLQHGYAHRNHAPPGERSCELGAHRPAQACLEELASGEARLRSAFGPRLAAMLVPPWNRIDEKIVARLPDAGFQALSTFGPRAGAAAAPALAQVNTHIDLIAWRRGRIFIGAPAAIDRLVEHLRERREGRVDSDEPTGVLTHHLDLEQGAWDFLDALLERTSAHAGALWIDAREAMAPTEALTSSRSA